MESYVAEVTSILKKHFADAKLFSYGHVGDSNLHFSIAPGVAQDLATINDLVYKPLQKLNGSISAEHGIGIDKKQYLSLTRSEEEIQLMRCIKKKALDPKNILNPGKLFDC